MDNIQINDVYIIDNDDDEDEYGENECILIVGKTTHFLKIKMGFYEKLSPTEYEIITYTRGTKKKLFTDNDGAYIKYSNGKQKRYFRDERFCFRLIDHSYQLTITHGSFH